MGILKLRTACKTWSSVFIPPHGKDDILRNTVYMNVSASRDDPFMLGFSFPCGLLPHATLILRTSACLNSTLTKCWTRLPFWCSKNNTFPVSSMHDSATKSTNRRSKFQARNWRVKYNKYRTKTLCNAPHAPNPYRWRVKTSCYQC